MHVYKYRLCIPVHVQKNSAGGSYFYVYEKWKRTFNNLARINCLNLLQNSRHSQIDGTIVEDQFTHEISVFAEQTVRFVDQLQNR